MNIYNTFKSFSKKEMLDELKLLIYGDIKGMGNFYNSKLANNVLEDGINNVLPCEISIHNLRITRKFIIAYDLVMLGKMDMLGGFINPEDIWQDLVTFIRRIKVSEGTDTFGELCEPNYCEYIANAASGLMKLDNYDKVGWDISLKELAAVEKMSESSVKNSLSKHKISFSKDYYGDSCINNSDAYDWIQSRETYKSSEYYDSINKISNKVFNSSMVELNSFIQDRANKINLSSENYFKLTGWDLDRFDACGKFDIGKLNQFDLNQWKKIANALDVNCFWLMNRIYFMLHMDDLQIYTDLAWSLSLSMEKEKFIKDKKYSVPVASDGTVFHPGLRRKKGYEIGKRNINQHYVESFETALSELNEMEIPYWRRPSAGSGVYGTVKGIAWKDITKSELYNKNK